MEFLADLAVRMNGKATVSHRTTQVFVPLTTNDPSTASSAPETAEKPSPTPANSA